VARKLPFNGDLFRFNLKSRNVEIRNSKDSDDIANLQKAADFVRAFVMGFDVEVSDNKGGGGWIGVDTRDHILGRVGISSTGRLVR
jgi:hypothetical protein